MFVGFNVLEIVRKSVIMSVGNFLLFRGLCGEFDFV